MTNLFKGLAAGAVALATLAHATREQPTGPRASLFDAALDRQAADARGESPPGQEKLL
jgi:hypothetical protein